MMAEPFPAGAEVEVKLDVEGFYGSWYEAKVLNRHCNAKYQIQYLSLLRDDGSGQPLVEDVFAVTLRPRAPRRLSTSRGGTEDEDTNFEMHDLVEAYHSDGWWQGVLSGLKNPETGLYTVSFPNTREIFKFKSAAIRPQLDFVNGEWVPFLGKAEAKEAFSKCRTYRKGEKVEVFRIRDDYGPSYFPALVEEVIHDAYYLVRYESVHARPDLYLTEILDPQFLRPAPDVPPKIIRFGVDSHVEVFHEGGWSPGVVLSCLSGSKEYAVTVKSKGRSMTVNCYGSHMRLRLEWNGTSWNEWDSHPPKEKKRKLAYLSEICGSNMALTESSETTPSSVSFTGKKVKEGSEEVQELQSPSQVKDTPRKESLDSDENISILQLARGKSGPSKSKGSSGPRIKRSVLKVSRSHVLLRELKTYDPKISKGKRSGLCRRKLHGCAEDKMQDEVNNNGGTSSRKQKDVNLSNESSSNEPQPNANDEKAAAHVVTPSCEPHLGSKANYTADLVGENAVGASPHERTMGPMVGSESQYLLNTQDSPSSDDAEISKSHELDDSLPLNSSRTLECPTGSQDKSLNPTLNRLVSSTDQVSRSSLTSSDHVSPSAVLSADQASPLPPSDGATEISKGCRLGDTQCLDLNTTLQGLTESQDNSSIPNLNRMVSSADKVSPLPLLKKLVSTEPNADPHPDKHSLVDKPVTSDIVLPFKKTSPVWKSLETILEVFMRIPQTPHFMKLESKSKSKREGIAIGMMITYDNLAKSIQTLSVDTEATVIEEKLFCLDSLEENGFIVDPIRTRLQRVLELKGIYAKLRLELVELESELANKEEENASLLALTNALEAKLGDAREEIAKLNEKIAKLNEKEKACMVKRAACLDLTAGLECNISRLREQIVSISRSNELALEELGRFIAEPL